MQHSFDIEIAKEYGIIEAILLNNFQFWIEKNKANNINFYDGYYWTYNSTKALNELFPYLSQRRIQNALKHLRDEGILQVGNYNKLSYDRTLWYAFTKKGECIMQKREMDCEEKGNGECENVQAIPDINTDINADVNSNNIYTSEFEKLWSLYPRKQGKEKAKASFVKARQKGVSYEEIEQGLLNYVDYIKYNKVKAEYIKHGSTWFNQCCWGDTYDINRQITTADLVDKYDFSEFR